MRYKTASQANEELREKVEAEVKAEFFANISHSFKDPINIILSSAEVMRKKMALEGEEFCKRYDSFLLNTEQNCHRLLRLTEDLIEATKLDSLYINPKFKKNSIDEIIRQIVSLSRPYAMARNIKIDYENQNVESEISCDQEMIDRVMLNLLSNAIKNTKADGHIRVVLSEDAEHCYIKVIDSGIGISEERQKKLFDKNGVERLDGQGGGCGLGLKISKALIELHKGKITVQSELDKGSCFEFSLSKNMPLSQEEFSFKKTKDGVLVVCQDNTGYFVK